MIGARKPAIIERLANRPDPPVHHVAGRDHVGAGPGMRNRLRASSSSVASFSTAPSCGTLAAVAVIGVLAQQTSVIDEQFRMGLLDRPRGELNDALLVPRARAFLILGRRDPEQQHRGDSQRLRAPPLGDRMGIDGRARCLASPGDRLAPVDAVRDTSDNEIRRLQARLADQAA